MFVNQSIYLSTYLPTTHPFIYHYHHHHHHWHNRPFWAKAFFRSFCQLSLLLAAFLLFLSPNFLASSITPSSHLCFGLPLCLLPSTTATRTLPVGLCSSIRITCPAHFNRLILTSIYLSIYMCVSECLPTYTHIYSVSVCLSGRNHSLHLRIV